MHILIIYILYVTILSSAGRFRIYLSKAVNIDGIEAIFNSSSFMNNNNRIKYFLSILFTLLKNTSKQIHILSLVHS